MNRSLVLQCPGITTTMLAVSLLIILPGVAIAEPLVIAASPSVAAPLEALASAFEAAHPEVQVRIHYDSGLGLRQSIAAMQNNGRHFIGTGPFHLVAPSSSEVLDRLEQRYYVLPGTRRAYATVPLVLIVPGTLVEAPDSFEALGKGATQRVAIADPTGTELGIRTETFLRTIGIMDSVKERVDVAHDAKGVLDHVMNGEADVGIVFGSDAFKERERVRVVATSTDETHRPIVYYIAMERYCPNRALCQEFLAFTQSAEAQAALKQVGYGAPRNASASPSAR